MAKNIDLRVRKTIQYLLAESLSNPSIDGIVMICDDQKNRDKCRQRLFGMWFKDAIAMGDTKFGVTKYDSDLAGLGVGFLLLRNDCDHHKEIRNSFLSLSCSDK